jgi:GT2 family glycosyltransferase
VNSDGSPGWKRDFGADKAKGNILAFIDADAYPDRDWIKEALYIFKKYPKVVAVGGPGITPPQDSVAQKISGLIYESTPISYRYKPQLPRFVKELPSCNLFVRKSVFNKVGGFDCSFYPGEDSVLCAKLLKHGKILYSPLVVVYHHRRSFPWGHWKQVANYGRMRGILIYGLVTTVIVYGYNFIKGFLKKNAQ